MPHSHDGRCCDRCLRRWEFTSRLLDESDDADASSTGSTSSEDSTLRQSDDDFVELSPVEWNSADEYHHSIYSSSTGSSEHWAEADASPSSSSASSSSSLTDERGNGAVPDSDLSTDTTRLRRVAAGQGGNSITSSGMATGLRATLPLRQQETSAAAIRPESGSGSGSRPGPEDDLVRQSDGNSTTSDAAIQKPSELWTRRFNRRLERRPTFLAGNTSPEDAALSEARPPVASLASMLRSLDVHSTPTALPGNKRRKTRDARSDAEVPLLSLEELSDSSGRSGRSGRFPSQQPPLDTWRAPQQSPVLRRQSRIELMRQGSERWHDETMPVPQESGRRAGNFQPRQSRITYWPTARSSQGRNHPGVHGETS